MSHSGKPGHLEVGAVEGAQVRVRGEQRSRQECQTHAGLAQPGDRVHVVAARRHLRGGHVRFEPGRFGQRPELRRPRDPVERREIAFVVDALEVLGAGKDPVARRADSLGDERAAGRSWDPERDVGFVARQIGDVGAEQELDDQARVAGVKLRERRGDHVGTERRQGGEADDPLELATEVLGLCIEGVGGRFELPGVLDDLLRRGGGAQPIEVAFEELHPEVLLEGAETTAHRRHADAEHPTRLLERAAAVHGQEHPDAIPVVHA